MTLDLGSAAEIVASVAICQAAGAIGAAITDTGSSAWYQALEKPWWRPPGWVFGPTWFALYTLLGIAAWMVFRAPGSGSRRRRALGLFAVQLVLNAVWTPLFFGAHRIVAATSLSFAILVLAIATAIAFRRIVRVAGLLLVPYVAWLVYAFSLNAVIAWANA